MAGSPRRDGQSQHRAGGQKQFKAGDHNLSRRAVLAGGYRQGCR